MHGLLANFPIEVLQMSAEPLLLSVSSSSSTCTPLLVDHKQGLCYSVSRASRSTWTAAAARSVRRPVGELTAATLVELVFCLMEVEVEGETAVDFLEALKLA
jgi:hypothetical protein